MVMVRLKIFMNIFITMLLINISTQQVFCISSPWNLTQKISEITYSEENNFFIKIAIIQHFNKNFEPVFFNIDNQMLKSYGLFEQADITSLILNINLNFYSFVKKIEFESFINTLFTLSNIDILITPGFTNKGWFIYYKNQNKLAFIKFNFDEILNIDKSVDIEKLHNVLTKVLGFNGIVLDIKNNYVLVSLNPKNYKKNLQAVVLNNSTNEVCINPKNKEADALIQLVESNGHVGVFEILVLSKDVKTLLPGSKIIVNNN